MVDRLLEEHDCDWPKFKYYILNKDEAIAKSMEGIYKTLTRVEINIAKLQVKSGIWGFVGGLIPVLITVFIMLIKALTTGG